jgi:uncharacterized protein (DUF1810 family)
MTPAYDLDRFLAAQNPIFPTVLAELGSGRKRTHWMWFVFPQLKGLGASRASDVYGLASLEEASAYRGHDVLGGRLEAALAALDGSGASSIHAVFGSPDDLKFRSSMTLFAAADPEGPWSGAIGRWCEGRADERTLRRLGRA